MKKILFVLIFIISGFSLSQTNAAGLIDTISLGLSAKPVDIAIDENANRIYVADQNNKIIIVDGNTNQIITDLQLDYQPQKILFDGKTNHLYVAGSTVIFDMIHFVVSKIDGGTFSTSEILVNLSTWAGGFEVNITGMDFNEELNILYISNFLRYPDGALNGVVGLFDLNTDKLIKFFGGGEAITDIKYIKKFDRLFYTADNYIETGFKGNGDWEPVGGRAVCAPSIKLDEFVFNSNTNYLYATTLDGRLIPFIVRNGQLVFPNDVSNCDINAISIGGNLINIDINKETQIIYLLNADNQSVIGLNSDTGLLYNPINVGLNPVALSINNITNRIYVANFGDGTISIIDGFSPIQTPSQFWSQVQNSPTGRLNLSQTPDTQNKPADDILKAVPNEWVVKVLNTADENGNNVELDGYRWYKVEDVTDGIIGWMSAISLVDGTVYLDYNQNLQEDLRNKASEQLDTKEKRIPIILESVGNYYTKDNSVDSLYGGGDGFDDNNNFQRFIQGSNFPRELILAISAVESGGLDFNNEICSTAKDGGIGIMQITSRDFKGLGSGLENYPKKNDCNARTGWIGDFSKYYSNAFQGIYANIKDGFRVLQEKYRQKCPNAQIIIDGLMYTCQDIERVLTTWGYNGKVLTGNYLRQVSDALSNLSSFFSGITYPNTDQLIEKLALANRHRIEFMKFSPVEIQVADSQGRITGFDQNAVKEEIPFSRYDGDDGGGVIFFPQDLYIYRVIGTSDGTYGFRVEFTENDTLGTFSAVDIPITADEIYEYIIDWGALDRGERGVTIKVDKEGDGVFDYQFQSLASLQDKIAPDTEITLSGQIGANNWYLSDVQVNLSANDNYEGVGVLKTEYSLDNGTTWNVYTGPFSLSNEGINSVIYRSQDFLGNLENAKTIEIKIDKTPPEAKIYFDKDAQSLKIEGVDNLTSNPKVTSTTVGFVFPSEEIKNIESYIKDKYSKYGYGMPLFYQTNTDRQKVAYKIQDDAGHTLMLNFKKLFDRYYFIYAQLESLQYDNSPIINLSKNKLYYFWFLDRSDKEINFLYQKTEVLDQFTIEAFYNHYKDETKIELERDGIKQNQILPGLAIIKLTTKLGNLGFEF